MDLVAFCIQPFLVSIAVFYFFLLLFCVCFSLFLSSFSICKQEEEKSKIQLWLKEKAGYKKQLDPSNVEELKVSAQVVSLVDLLVDQAHADIT
jgi:hypothetical protein